MACSNPMLMDVIDIKGLSWKLIHSLTDNYGYKINYDNHRAYRLVSRDSRSLPLEEIEDWRKLKTMELPCCKCIQCRLDYSKNWAIRCYLESLQYKDNYFVTLTYDDNHLFYGKNGNPTLVREHLSQFMKDLRQKFKREFGFTGVRFFGCGEYGSQSLRPHLHIILFNCPLPDLTPTFIDDDGNTSRHVGSYGDIYYYSQFIKDCWKYGFIMVADANYNTEAYVSRYILKKQKGKDGIDLYEKQLGVCSPFLGMSNRPGIGQNYLDEHELDLLDNPSLIVPRHNKEPMISGIPRYYKNKLYKKHPHKYDQMLEKAKENTIKARSLLKQNINDNREAVDCHITKSFETFSRNKV